MRRRSEIWQPVLVHDPVRSLPKRGFSFIKHQNFLQTDALKLLVTNCSIWTGSLPVTRNRQSVLPRVWLLMISWNEEEPLFLPNIVNQTCKNTNTSIFVEKSLLVEKSVLNSNQRRREKISAYQVTPRDHIDTSPGLAWLYRGSVGVLLWLFCSDRSPLVPLLWDRIWSLESPWTLPAPSHRYIVLPAWPSDLFWRTVYSNCHTMFSIYTQFSLMIYKLGFLF